MLLLPFSAKKNSLVFIKKRCGAACCREKQGKKVTLLSSCSPKGQQVFVAGKASAVSALVGGQGCRRFPWRLSSSRELSRHCWALLAAMPVAKTRSPFSPYHVKVTFAPLAFSTAAAHNPSTMLQLSSPLVCFRPLHVTYEIAFVKLPRLGLWSKAMSNGFVGGLGKNLVLFLRISFVCLTFSYFCLTFDYSH